MLLAHGGAPGAAAEAAFLLLPLLVIAILAWRADRRARKRQADDEHAHRPPSPPV